MHLGTSRFSTKPARLCKRARRVPSLSVHRFRPIYRVSNIGFGRGEKCRSSDGAALRRGEHRSLSSYVEAHRSLPLNILGREADVETLSLYKDVWLGIIIYNLSVHALQVEKAKYYLIFLEILPSCSCKSYRKSSDSSRSPHPLSIKPSLSTASSMSTCRA